MKIKSIESQYHRDFYAVYECEHCGKTCQDIGYDDAHFHINVIPNMKCKSCGKTASDDYQPRQTKYAAHEVI